MPSDPPEEERRPPKMLGTISILKWTPNLKKVREVLDGHVPPQQGDVISHGGQQWPMKPE